MNTLPKLLAVIAALSVLLAPQALAQRQLGKKKGPTSKLYLAETKGEGSIITDGKSYEPRQATAFDAPGTVIETSAQARQVFVYSNGTVMTVDENTRVVIEQFIQETFDSSRSGTEIEPSSSQSEIYLARGKVGIQTGQLVSGTTMNYRTDLARVNIRGGEFSIVSKEDYTAVYLLTGDITVYANERDSVGTVLRPGEQIIIRAGTPPLITVGPLDFRVREELVAMGTTSNNARNSVSFEMIERVAAQGPGEPGGRGAASETGAGPTEEIVARPTVPAKPPSNITVSPDRINPGPGGH